LFDGCLVTKTSVCVTLLGYILKLLEIPERDVADN